MPYDVFQSVADAKRTYTRCRTQKEFILTDDTAGPLKCARCGKTIADDDSPPGYRSNRCIYYPKTKKIAVMHYMCAWENVMGAVFGTEKLI